MLETLAKYSRDRGLVTEPGFTTKLVRWAIHCSDTGEFLAVTELGDTGQKRNRGVEMTRCPDLSLPEMKAGGTGCRHFLVDTVQVVVLLGFDDLQEDERQKLHAKHEYFRRLLHDSSNSAPAVRSAARCLERPGQIERIRNQLKTAGARPTDNVTFTVGSQFLVESSDWHDWWRAFRRNLNERRREIVKTAPKMRCLLSGDLVEPVPTHPKVQGLSDVGGIAMGDSLVSFKQESFCSYGLTQAANAAVSEDGAAAYRAALNRILQDTGVRLARAKVGHWFKSKIPQRDDPLPWLFDPNETDEVAAVERARSLLNAIRTGQRADLRNNYYYALTLSGAAGRVMVRDWMEGQFEELVESVEAWFNDLSIVRRDGAGLAAAPKFAAVLSGLVRDLKDIPAPTVASLWRVAVRREPFPRPFLAKALERVRVDVIQNNTPLYARMGILRAFHVRKGDQKMTVSLNPAHPSAAYHCGRLMALLASVQYRALGDVGAGLVQRYYAAASSTPALVLGRLTRTSQFHLDKLEPALRRWFQGKISEIWNAIRDHLPRTLTLEEQSLFALGYYHQMAADRATAQARASEKESNSDGTERSEGSEEETRD